MTTAQQQTADAYRKTAQTEDIRINPKAELTEEVGNFLVGALRQRRDVPFEGRTFKVYEFQVEAGNFTAYEGKGDAKKKAKWTPGDRVDVKGTAMINWALSNIADGEKVLIEYRGTRKSQKKGQNDAHDFLIQRVISPASK